MPFCKITFTPPAVLRNPPRLLRTIRRPFAIPISRQFALTSWRFEGRRTLSSSVMMMMSSDADYVAFLKKSQTDYSRSSESETPASATTEAHPAVEALGERFYVSDADEPFEGVSFSWEKETLPDEGLCSPLKPFPPSTSAFSCNRPLVR